MVRSEQAKILYGDYVGMIFLDFLLAIRKYRDVGSEKVQAYDRVSGFASRARV